MRMRKKKNLPQRMAACSHLLENDPKSLAGKWLGENSKLHVEIGCGKGTFITEQAMANPTTSFVAIERVPEALVMAMEKAASAGLTNVRFICFDAVDFDEIFQKGEIDRIYINFCDPWPSRKNMHKRLTFPGFLAKYKNALNPEGSVHFKTDNADLFNYSLKQFVENGFRVENATFDLHSAPNNEIRTEYEQRFIELGTPICRCEAYPVV